MTELFFFVYIHISNILTRDTRTNTFVSSQGSVRSAEEGYVT